MKKSILAISFLVAAVGLSACSVKSPDDINKDLQKQLNQDNKNNDDLTKGLNKYSPTTSGLDVGGQPGIIQVAGVIVDKDAKLDERITVVANAGVGINGTSPSINETDKPKFSSKIENLDLSKTSTEGLISIGCDDKVAADFAKERSIKIQQIPQPMSKGFLIVTAKTIVFCGDLKKGSGDALKNDFLTFMADEIIFDHVDFTKLGWNGAVTFDTNKLLLLGSSILETKGVAASVTLIMTPMLTLDVLKEISSDEDGKLLLSSTGSNYEAPTK